MENDRSSDSSLGEERHDRNTPTDATGSHNEG